MSISLLIAVVSVSSQFLFAKESIPELDDRCDLEKSAMVMHERVNGICMNEATICIQNRILELGESHTQAKEFCYHQPLSLDSRFVGPCPDYLSDFEKRVNDDEGILLRTFLRLYFVQNNQGNSEHQTFKQRESKQSINRFLAENPDNLAGLSLLRSLLDENDLVDSVKLEIQIHGLDPDCPESRLFHIDTLHFRLEELIEKWLTGEVPQSKLTESEFIDLARLAWHTVLDMYDIAIDQSSSVMKLYYALRSIDDDLLSGTAVNFAQIESSLDLDLENFAEKRRKVLVRALVQEYGIDSIHGRAKTLAMMCNDYAFQLGLVEHCLKLLEYYGQKDAQDLRFGGTLATDWALAAIFMVNAITRDCIHTSEILSIPRLFSKETQCFAEFQERFNAHIETFLAKLPQIEPSAEKELLEAFLRLNETSDEYFLHALELDASVVTHAANLSKRLHKRGWFDAATNVLNASLVAVEQGHFKAFNWNTDRDIEMIRRSLRAVERRKYENFFEHPKNAAEVDDPWGK